MASSFNKERVSVVHVYARGKHLVIAGIVDGRHCVKAVGWVAALEKAPDRNADGNDGEYMRRLLLAAAYPAERPLLN